MNDHRNDDCDLTLDGDADWLSPLARVHYAAGMLLGVAALHTDQDYHRRRLGRHQHWLHGAGTVFGLAVVVDDDAPDGTPDPRITVRPGLAIDGLGREVLVPEPHCLRLNEWLATRDAGALLAGRLDDGRLGLLVTLRQRDCPRALQPVVAEGVNAGTDAVRPARVSDDLALELIPQRPPDSPALRPGWPGLPLPEEAPLTSEEQVRLAEASPAAARRLRLAARLIHSPPPERPLDRTTRHALAEQLARVPLARLTVTLDDDSHANDVAVDNLMRPMLTTPAQLAWLFEAEDSP